MIIDVFGVWVTMLCGFAKSPAEIHQTYVWDTHVHNADITHLQYSFPYKWPDLDRNWTMEDYLNATRDVKEPIAAILMELEKANNTPEVNRQEALFYQQVMNNCDCHKSTCCVKCFVIGAQLELGELKTRSYLNTIKSDAPGFCGVRQGLWDKDDSFILDPDFIAGLSVLADFDVPFDLLIKPNQMGIISELVSKLPNLTFNLNHIGYPNISSPVFDQAWATGIENFATFPNIYFKLSGLPQGYGSKAWKFYDFRPYIDFLLHEVPANRINFAGNWFVETEFSSSYAAMYDAITTNLRQLGVTGGEQWWIMTGTASNLYG